MNAMCPSCEDPIIYAATSRYDNATSICYSCGVLEAVAQMVMTRDGNDPADALVAPGVVNLSNMPLNTLHALVELLRSNRKSAQSERSN